jgi:hypothetical protein
LSRLHDSRFMRGLYLALGVTALLLGGLGIVLPVLPTTPFILLAAGCFARGSERFHEWILGHRIAGPLIRAWREYRAMPRGAKQWAYALTLLSFGSSILLMTSPWHRVMLVVLGIVLGFFLWRVPVRELPESRRPEQAERGPSREEPAGPTPGRFATSNAPTRKKPPDRSCDSARCSHDR